MKHRHAELIMMYAEDAMKTDEPWKLWEVWSPGCGWVTFHSTTQFHPNSEFRRKPKTININGFEVPEPERKKPENGEAYWVVRFGENDNVYSWDWDGDMIDYANLKSGIIHKTKEAAMLHAKALLSFTKVDGDKS